MLTALQGPWPWYVAGPLIGLMVPALLLLGGKTFSISSNLRHLCTALLPDRPSRPELFHYDWRQAGGWNLTFAAGIVLGGFLAATFLANPEPVAIAESTRTALAGVGIAQGTGLLPVELFSWAALTTPAGWLVLVGGGFLIGFGARWAGGCTSGHAISGIAALELSSLIAVLGFFAGGLLAAHVLIPRILANLT